MGMGMTLIIVTSSIDLSAGSVMGFVGCVAASLQVRMNVDTGLVIAICLALGALISIAQGSLITYMVFAPDFLELLYVKTGTGVYIVDEERYHIKRGGIIICNANVLHDEDAAQSKNLNTLSVAVSDVNIKRLPKNCLIAANVIPIVHTNGSAISEIMSIIYEFLSDIASDMTETCTYLAIALICNVLDIINKQKENNNNFIKKRGYIIVKQVKLYIDNNFTNDITLQAIGKEINISPYHLAHVLKNSTGYSPIQYVLRRRIGEAQSLLITTKLSITDIPLSVGYNNSCHFNLIFSKYIGMSPSRYRNLYVKEK